MNSAPISSVKLSNSPSILIQATFSPKPLFSQSSPSFSTGLRSPEQREGEEKIQERDKCSSVTVGLYRG